MKKALLIMLLSLVAGCQTTPVSKPIIKDEEVFNYPYETVWKSIVKVFAQNRYPIKAIEKDSGLITSDWISFQKVNYSMTGSKHPYAVMPSNLYMMIWKNARGTITAYVTNTSENTTTVQIIVHIEAYEDNVSKQWHACYSKGVLENKIFQDIRMSLR